MFKKTSPFIALLLLGVILFIAVPKASAQFNFFKDSCKNNATQSTSNSNVCKDNTTTRNSSSNPVTETINDAANIIASIAGVLAVVMIVYSGFQFVTAGGVGFKSASGSPTKAAQARATLLYSLVGLVVIALAWTITRFITDRVLQ